MFWGVWSRGPREPHPRVLRPPTSILPSCQYGAPKDHCLGDVPKPQGRKSWQESIITSSSDGAEHTPEGTETHLGPVLNDESL